MADVDAREVLATLRRYCGSGVSIKERFFDLF